MTFSTLRRSGFIGGAYPKDYNNAGIKSLDDYSSPGIITNNLDVYVDAANLNSYPGSGTTWTDLSGNGRNGTLVNGPTFSSNDGGYIQTDGVNDAITFGTNFNYTTQAFTIGMWANIVSLDATNGQNVCLFYKGTYQTNGYYAEIGPFGNSINFYTNQSGAAQFTNPNTNTNSYANRWTHFMWVRNGSSIRIYLNGVDRTNTAGTHTNPSSSTSTFALARYGTSSNYSSIRWGAFYVWQSALSDIEVYQMFSAGRKRFGV